MPLSVWFWILLAVWLIFSLWLNVPLRLGQPAGWPRFLLDLLEFVLFLCLGAAVFSGPVKF